MNDICNVWITVKAFDSHAQVPLSEQYRDYNKYKHTGAPTPLSDPPHIIKMTDHHLQLAWKPSVPTMPRYPVTYQLEMLDLPDGDWHTVRTGIRRCDCNLRDLEPFRDYRFRVRVENKFGVSDPSPYLQTYRYIYMW